MEHSNVFYIRIGGRENAKYEPVRTAMAYKNDLGLDLFRHDHGKISEGKTGMSICSPDSAIKTFDEVVKKYGAERLINVIEDTVKIVGYSPRYTQPKVMKKDLFEKVEKQQPRSVMAMDTYGERHRYIKIYDEGKVIFYILESQEGEFNATLYVLLNGVMIGVDQRHCIEEAKTRVLQMGDFAEYAKFMLDKQLSNAAAWADPGLGLAFNRLDEVKEHNAPIRAKRDAEHEAYEAQREAKRLEDEQKRREKYESTIADAKARLKAHKDLQNVSITNPNTGWETSIVLHLMKEYGIKVPLKTQGWVNDALASLVPSESGGYSYRWYKRHGKTESTVFFKYLDELYEAVVEGGKES